MEIKNVFLEGNLDISVESTSLEIEGENQYNLLINDDCYTLSRQEWIEIKDFIENAIDFIDCNN
jgi:hypothetical protein